MEQQVLILTTTESINRFPENFSCWCAGALAAKGCKTQIEIIELENLTESPLSKNTSVKQAKLNKLQHILSIVERLILVLPEHNNMLPVGLDDFIELLARKKKYKICKLVTIVTDFPLTHNEHTNSYTLFNYPPNTLDTFFGPAFSTNRIKIKNSPSGDMCHLFTAFYSNLCTLIQQILA